MTTEQMLVELLALELHNQRVIGDGFVGKAWHQLSERERQNLRDRIRVYSDPEGLLDE